MLHNIGPAPARPLHAKLKMGVFCKKGIKIFEMVTVEYEALYAFMKPVLVWTRQKEL